MKDKSDQIRIEEQREKLLEWRLKCDRQQAAIAEHVELLRECSQYFCHLSSMGDTDAEEMIEKIQKLIGGAE